MATTPTFGWPTPDDTDLVRDGAAAIRALGDAVDGYAAGGYVYAGTIYYTSSGTFVKADPFGTGDIGLRAVRVRLVGGGGGGSGVSTLSRSAGGGAGGGYAEAFILASSLGSSETVTRGAGGTAGPATNTLGGAGGTSSFGTTPLVEATGGESAGSIFDAQNGGVGTIGDLLIRGGAGGKGDATSAQQPGIGGSSMLGGGGRTQGGTAGSAGGNYGGGGGGGSADISAQPGGAGANGIVIVDCFV